MRLNVRHETRYDYEQPVAYSVQRLYLTPPSFASQKIISWSITAPGMEGALSYLDGFGNWVHLVTASGMHDHVTIVAEGVAECADTAGVIRGLHCPAPDGIFLRQTKATEPDPAIVKLAQEARASNPTVLEQLHALMRFIHEEVAYEIGATDAHTTAAQALAEGRGVCQDHTHLFLSAVRSLGIPARYVTGYLVIHDRATASASHAWAEVLVPDLGWVGFDAANSKCPTEDYVRVAAGLDAAGVVPVRGSRKGGDSERMTVEVAVNAEQQ
jgi:transglutaminase-like putative cysteine protease